MGSDESWKGRLERFEDNHPWRMGAIGGAIFAVGVFAVQMLDGAGEGILSLAVIASIAGCAYAVFAAIVVPKMRKKRRAS